MVIALSALLMTVGVMLVQQTIQTDPLLQANSVQHAAYRGLEAGMNSYQSIVNTNPNLANCNQSTNAESLCQGALYQTWNLVSQTTGGSGTIPEWYLFDNPQPVFNSDGSLSTLKVQIVGVAGFPGFYAYESAVANLAPVNGFLTTLWWSDYEASDPSATNPNYRGRRCLQIRLAEQQSGNRLQRSRSELHSRLLRSQRHHQRPGVLQRLDICHQWQFVERTEFRRRRRPGRR